MRETGARCAHTADGLDLRVSQIHAPTKPCRMSFTAITLVRWFRKGTATDPLVTAGENESTVATFETLVLPPSLDTNTRANSRGAVELLMY